MQGGLPEKHVGFSSSQRAAMRAVEEEAILDLVTDFVQRANRLGDRLDAYATTSSDEQERQGDK